MVRKAIERKTDRGATEVIIQNTSVVDLPAEWALEIAGSWGAVAGHPDGEDSAGRAKLRLMTADELVERSCEVAEKLLAAFQARNWMIDVPDPKPPIEDDEDK